MGSLIITDAVNVGLKPLCPQDGLPKPRLENFASHIFVLFHAQLKIAAIQFALVGVLQAFQIIMDLTI